MADYGVGVKIQEGEKVEYPDFTLELVGKREEAPTPPSHLPKHWSDYKVSKDNEEKVVSWTSGTGLMVPANFEFLGNNYSLDRNVGGDIVVEKL